MLIRNKDKLTKYGKDKIEKRDNFTFMNKNHCKDGQVVFAGDSITEFLSTGDWYGEYTAKSGLAVYNRGIGGDTSDRLLERLTDNVLCINPCCIVILIGTNDLGLGIKDMSVNKIEEILNLIHKTNPQCKVILQSVYPVNGEIKGSSAGRRKNGDILRINAELPRLAEKYGAVYLDLWNDLSDSKGNLSAEYTYDGLHLNAAGYKVTTERIIPLLPQ